MSPPVRRRGLKPKQMTATGDRVGIASRAEAWIETRLTASSAMVSPVASRAEAWIETPQTAAKWALEFVASRAEAWIETVCFFGDIRRRALSPPVRRRGLKPVLWGLQ